MKLKQLSERYEASEIFWEKALNAVEKEIRIRKVRSVIITVAAFLAGAGFGYGLKAVVDGR